MPLPDGSVLSLHVNANAVQSKPKRAMIVRMSAETLDALDAFPNHPPLSFDFGDAPGIYIGDAFFPMHPQKESISHELYLRAASAAKPMAPLKLYANVIGKFMVERQLGDKVTNKVRQQTLVAKQQHMERQAILLDQPPIPVTAKGTKRKWPGSGTVVKKPVPDPHRLAPSSSAPSGKVSPHQSKASADVRRRLVHCLAISPRLAEDAVKMVGGANISTSAREDLLALLEHVAEQSLAKKGDKSPRPWALKPQAWTEVRPFEWPKLTETERITMARQARMAFKSLKIPESDPAWDNVRYRATAPTIPPVPPPPPLATSSSGRSSTSAQPETKRAAISKDAKIKPKHDVSRAKGEIHMKDESTKTTSRVDAIKRAEVDRSSSPSEGSSATKSVPPRRLPGSGYQVKKSPQPSASLAENPAASAEARPASKPPPAPSLPSKPPPPGPPAGGSHARKTIPTMPPKTVKKEDESDREREKQDREKEKRREELDRERELERRERAKQKEREATEREKRQREKEREREREEMEQDKRQRDKDRIAKERAGSTAVPPIKRKTVPQESEDTLDGVSSKAVQPKRRKLDDGTSVPSSSLKAQRAELPKKPPHDPSSVPHLKMKKEASSPQPSLNADRRATASASGSTHKAERPSKASSGLKPRRRSPIYTSSENEGEVSQPRKRNPSPPPISDRSNSSDQPQSEKAPRHHRTTRGTFPLPTDHAALRALYQSQYTTYLGAFSKVVAQKHKLEAMLKGDSDVETDVMDPDELTKLSMEHKTLKSELERIHEVYIRGMGAVAVGGSSSDG